MPHQISKYFMYTLEQARQDSKSHTSEENWEGKISCFYANKEKAMGVNKLRDTVEVYAFTLVRKGNLVLQSNDNPLVLHRNDLYINLPGFRLKMISASDDYLATCLLIDASTSIDTPASKYMVRTAHFPILEMKEPKLTLTEEEGIRLEKVMEMIRYHVMNGSINQEKILKTLYSVFVLELMDIAELKKSKVELSERSEDLYISFIRMLHKNFKEHHDITFYANELNVSPTYLSRLIKQVTNHTVMEFINQMLLFEASWLLTTTDKPIAQIAEELHFSDQASFSKFFLRLKGIGPKDYRKKA